MTTITTELVNRLEGATIAVAPDAGEAYRVRIGDHLVRVDQPRDAGGENSAPTPTELFIASLAACVAYYAGRYLTRHGFTRDGLGVEARFTLATDRPARVARIRLKIRVPESLPAQRHAALLAVASHCTVHNSITASPDISIELA